MTPEGFWLRYYGSGPSPRSNNSTAQYDLEVTPMRKGMVPISLVGLVITAAFLFVSIAYARETNVSGDDPTYRSVLENSFLVTWYGNPHTGAMGVLGQFSGDDLANRLQKQADAYDNLTEKRVVPAYQLIAVVAQDTPGTDDKWRRRETPDVIDSMLQQARSHGFKLILDVQVGQSTVQDELAYLQPWLAQPDVYLALDPEFDMWTGQTPGIEFGHMNSYEVNYAIHYLDDIIRQDNLPPKVLIVHQFTLRMLPDKENIDRSPLLDIVLDIDGFGSQAIKLDTYKTVMGQGQLEFAGVKLFYDQDPGMFTPRDVVQLDPHPSVVIYQ